MLLAMCQIAPEQKKIKNPLEQYIPHIPDINTNVLKQYVQ